MRRDPEQYEFQVVGVDHAPTGRTAQVLPGRDVLDQWDAATGGGTALVFGEQLQSLTKLGHPAWDYRLVPCHVPERYLGYPICHLNGAQLFPAGAPLTAISLPPEPMLFGGKSYAPEALQAMLSMFNCAVQIHLYLAGERYHVGWMPAPLAGQLYARLQEFYVLQATVQGPPTFRCLQTTLRQKRRFVPDG